MNEKGWLVVGIIALAILIFGGIVVGGYNNLVQQQQQVKQGESSYGAALDLGSQKIEAVWDIYKTYLSHESELFENATRLRAQFYKSAAEGDPQATVNAAIAFQLLSVKEAFPQLVSAPIAKDTQSSFEESINEMKTALDDWIHATQVYNTQRNIFPNNVIGNMFGFPSEYDYYHSEKTKLNVSEILNK
jgi:LemA protein